MRIRLWAVAAICLLPLALVTATATAQERGTQITQNSAPEQFQKVPNIPDCATAAVQQGDPAKGVSVLLIKGTAGCNVPWHFHTPNEQLMMVSGTGRVQM